MDAPLTDHDRKYGIPSPTRAKSKWDPAYDRDRAAEARHGGRYITEQLASVLRPSGTFPFGSEQSRAVLAGEGDRYNYPPEALRNLWRGSLSPSGSDPESSGRETTARHARRRAEGKDVFGKDANAPRPFTLPEAEAMMDWPIYRAAMRETTFGDLWAQAAESEEPILSTLAHCAWGRP